MRTTHDRAFVHFCLYNMLLFSSFSYRCMLFSVFQQKEWNCFNIAEN